ncbi:F-box/kelch-repeat protein At3g23880-like [Argentina anserina]|uniref:F-box/kelch-repeat protein At3g23880-like n=1 Tax=Argentina anserina TaxID=57926 RepID=UPI0021764CCD|nr:F-box/kelch-repeat protein At3g23880-like [Potentilla anserina]
MKMETNNSSSSSFSITSKDLPCEIIEEILLQLPVKSLLRFKCVSKSWLNLISDHKFIKSHLHQSTKQHPHHDEISDTHLMLSSTSLIHSLHLQLSNTTVSANSQEEEEEAPAATDAVELESIVEYPVTSTLRRPAAKDIKIVGSCNGLLCLVLDSQHMIIYNPSTRLVREVPNPEETVVGKDYFYGFGYDSRNDDCKIVRATSSSREGNFVTQFDIFTLRTNAWRTKTKTLPFYFMSSVVGTLLNGALHWAVRRGINITPADGDGHDPRTFGIVSFDLTEETYKEVPLPCDGDKQFAYYGLGVLGGRLSMLHSPHGSGYQVWVMKEYGVKASWSVYTTIPQKMEDSKEYIGLMSLLCVLKNGEILMMLHNHKKAVLYNPGQRKFRTIFNGEIGSSQLALYLESLVSPKTYAPSSSPYIPAT